MKVIDIAEINFKGTKNAVSEKQLE